MIQIDDAGSGSLVGETCIGIYYDKKNIFTFDFIPLALYSPDNFKRKKYQQYVVEIFKREFSKLGVSKDEPIEVCQGYIFDALREYFVGHRFNWKNTKIQGLLQEKVEKTFSDYTVSLGLPKSYVTYTKFPFHFHKLLRWVYADYDNRKHLCKTGWKSWQKYKDLPVDTSFGYLDEHSFFCLKCGKKINSYSPVKILKFFSNKPNIIYLHKDC